MQSLSILATEIYISLDKNITNLNERREATKNFILNEITQWSIFEKQINGGYLFVPKEFKGNEKSPYFDVRLINNPFYDLLEMKFGNLNAETDEEKFFWDPKDPYRLQKALFLKKVISEKIIPLFVSKKIKGIYFTPYDGDGYKDDRVSYFYNMFKQLNKKLMNIHYYTTDNDEKYFITLKPTEFKNK